jgi:CheY-like chemotaxis protein
MHESEIVAIITDLHLPQSDGLAFIRQLRAEPRFARLPILLISGDSDPRLAQRALETGADAFFPKPYSPAAVRRRLEQLLC